MHVPISCTFCIFQQEQDNYGLVGGLNLNIIGWYVLSMTIASQLAVSVNTMVFLLKNKDAYQERIEENSKYPKVVLGLTILVGTLFPTHFTAFGLILTSKQSQELMNDNAEVFNELSAYDEDANAKYARIKQAIYASETELTSMINLASGNENFETILEHLPSAVLMSSLWIMSYTHEALRLFLSDTLSNLFSDFYIIIVILMSLKTTMGCVSSALNIRNAKRLPLTPKFFGFLLQYLMAISLFFPKLMLMSVALAYTPYAYPGMMVLEYLIIVSYQKIFFGSFGRKYSSKYLNSTVNDK